MPSEWRTVTQGMSESCERVFDAARAFAMGRGSDVVRVEHFVFALLHNGRHASTAAFLRFAADICVPTLVRLVQAACIVDHAAPPVEAALAPKLLTALEIARTLPEHAGEDADPVQAQAVLAVLLLDSGNFASRALREALPGRRGERTPAFLRLKASLLAAFGVVDAETTAALQLRLAMARDDDYADAPEEFCCPIVGELMRDPVATATGQTYDRSSIERWLRDHNTDPLTNQRLLSKALTPNHALRSLIQKWREQRSQAELPPPTPLDATPLLLAAR